LRGLATTYTELGFTGHNHEIEPIFSHCIVGPNPTPLLATTLLTSSYPWPSSSVATEGPLTA